MVHEHPIIVGCNPAVSDGVPITIDWCPVSTHHLSIDAYEHVRSPERVTQRILLRQSPQERWDILHNLGCLSEEMRLAEQDANEIRQLRQLSKHDSQQQQQQTYLDKLRNESKQRRRNLMQGAPQRSTFMRRMFR
jgi:hypothetical protein